MLLAFFGLVDLLSILLTFVEILLPGAASLSGCKNLEIAESFCGA